MTYVGHRVMLEIVIVFALFLMAGVFHKGFRQEFGARSVSR